jgi:citrate lyase subunit alpha/citrate CoA-transferase
MAAEKLVVNAAGRQVPTEVNGRPQVPFQGVGRYRPAGAKHGPPIRSCADFSAGGDKRVPDLEAAFRKCGLRDGMVISTHHHLRNGDQVALKALQTAARMGVRDPVLPSPATFR